MKNNMHLISFIIPVYNLQEAELHQCIESLVNQTYKDYEIIIVDDGSNNGIENYCDLLAKQFDIIVIHQLNQGLAAARNAGMRQAHGDWIVHVDGDDWVDVHLSQAIYESSISSNSDIILWGYVHSSNNCNIKYLLNNKHAFDVGFAKIKENVLCSILEYDTSFSSLALNTSWGKAYKRDFIRRNDLYYNVKLRRAQDAVYNLYAFCAANNVEYVDKAFSYYRADNVSLSRGYNPNNINNLTLTAYAVLEFVHNYGGSQRLNQASNVFVQRCFRMINEQCIQHKDNPDSFWKKYKLFKKLINQAPFKEAFASNVKRIRFLDKITDWLYQKQLFSAIDVWNKIRIYASLQKNKRKSIAK